MFEPILICGVEATYQELLREAERERRVKGARWDVLTFLALLRTLAGA